MASLFEPDRDCPLCPRLASFREKNRSLYPQWFNAPVPSFGDADARLLIVGLAPGLKGADGKIVRWANIECSEGVAGVGKFPSDEEILNAARALPR